MHAHVTSNSLEFVTTRAQLAEGIGVALLAAVSIFLAGSLIGFGLIVAVLFAAFVIHSAIRYT
jgi:hypothetical protein